MALKANAVYTGIVLPALVEFFGQLIFAFTHTSTANTITVTNATSLSSNALLPATNDGMTVAALASGFGHISGIHVNFAVTLAVFIAGGIEWWKVPIYLVAQCLGSLSGAAISLVANGEANGSFAIGAGASVGQALLMEIMISCFLTSTVLMAAVELQLPHAPFPIGLTIWIGIMAAFNISGGCMNPTLSLGPAVVSGQWDNYWIYWVGPLIGASISGLLFRILFSKNHNVLVACDDDDDHSDKANAVREDGNTGYINESSSQMDRM